MKRNTKIVISVLILVAILVIIFIIFYPKKTKSPLRGPPRPLPPGKNVCPLGLCDNDGTNCTLYGDGYHCWVGYNFDISTNYPFVLRDPYDNQTLEVDVDPSLANPSPCGAYITNCAPSILGASVGYCKLPDNWGIFPYGDSYYYLYPPNDNTQFPYPSSC